MGDDLLDLVEREITNNTEPDQIREKLIQKGYLEKDVDRAIDGIAQRKIGYSEEKRLVKMFSIKEVFDRIGYGFVPHQFINILLYLTGASFFWLGVLNGARAILSIIWSSMFQEYAKMKVLGKGVISKSGYLFGFSFLLMPVAILARSVPLFAFLLLLGSIGVATHGDLYNHFIRRRLKPEKMSHFLAGIGHYGVLITAVCILISGWLMDRFPVLGTETITFLGKTYPVYGYLISFEITAISFILSGYFLAHVKERMPEKRKVKGFFKKYIKDMKIYLGTFMHNKHLFLLILTAIILGFTQVLGNSYFGVFIYNEFRNIGLGGFMNVAIVYFIAVIASFLGPWFSKTINKHTGLAPTLVFGTLLTALMPLTLAYNPNLLAIGAANAFSVIGAAILGVSQGLLSRKLLREDERKVYFSVVSVAAVLPFLVMVPLGSYYAQLHGLVPLFKVLGLGLVLLVAPLYIILVLMSHRKRL